MTTRRNLLKSSLSLAAAPVGMSVAIEVAHAEDMPKWNNETDVLVLGYGNAGSNAAIAAADAGAKVLILEKTPAGGGNVSVSSGFKVEWDFRYSSSTPGWPPLSYQ